MADGKCIHLSFCEKGAMCRTPGAGILECPERARDRILGVEEDRWEAQSFDGDVPKGEETMRYASRRSLGIPPRLPSAKKALSRNG